MNLLATVALQEDLTLLAAPRAAAQPTASWPAWLVVVAVVALLLAAGLWRRRSRGVAGASGEPADVVALRELAAWEDASGAERCRAAVGAISATLRRYLETRFSLPASSQTTEEFWAAQHRERALPAEFEPFWRGLLSARDAIVYGGAAPDAAQFARLRAAARDFVHASRRAEVRVAPPREEEQ